MPPRPQDQTQPLPPIRMITGQAMAYLAMIALAACVYGLVSRERSDGDRLRDSVIRQQTVRHSYLARRGSIYDSNPINPSHFSTLACSCPLGTIYIDPLVLGHPGRGNNDPEIRRARRRQIIAELARVLTLSATAEGELVKRVEDELSEDRSAGAVRPAAAPALDDSDEPESEANQVARPVSRCIFVKRKASSQEFEAVRELIRENRWRGVVVDPELARFYPMNELASHQIGFLGSFNEPLEGLELVFNSTLSGIDGSKKMIASGNLVRLPMWSREQDYRPPQDGLSLVLHINAVIQGNVERILAETVKQYKAESGIAIVMDVRTGGLLAIANYPTFSLNEPGRATPEARKNSALGDPYEPGSIFKWVTVAAAIDAGVVRETDVFSGEGGAWAIPNARRTIRDVGSYGSLTVWEALVKSSNIVMAKIGMKMGPERLHKALTDFGFGPQKTGIELARTESAGMLSHHSQWRYGYSVPSISFGQEISVTSLQMVRGFAALCNDGYLLTPKLVRAIVDDSAVAVGGEFRIVKDLSAPEGKRILSAKTCRVLREMMCEVVTVGTGRRAKSEKYTIFGKTGTAEIFERDPLTGRGRNTGKYTSSFICGAPAEDPRIAVLVSVRKPVKSIGYYGGTVAAPACKQIVEATLGFLKVPTNPPPANPGRPVRR